MLATLRKRRQDDGGFTLVELLIVIVIIGILAAVVVIAVGSITDSGEDAACEGSADAASAASVAFFATQTDATPWPTLLSEVDDFLDLNDVTVLGNVITGKGWTLTMAAQGTPAGSLEPTFTCANL